MGGKRRESLGGTRILHRREAFVRLVRSCRLKVLAGPDRGSELVLAKRLISVGSHGDCDLVLRDSAVSRHHLELILDGKGFVLRDLGSTNGTFIGGLRIGEVTLSGKTRITLGESLVEFAPLPREEESPLKPRECLGELTGRSPAMLEVFDLIERVAPTDATVCITGETGTGKELVAETIHRLSPRTKEPFVVVDCASVPAPLFESELFGHERGAFTGAIAHHAGAFERANRGTLFLDEVSELDPALQPKLLRALERRSVQRLGGEELIQLDLRVIAASRRDLGQEVRQGRFRDDLYYRLAVVRIQLPPLRERREDIPLLAGLYLRQMQAIPGPDQAPQLPDQLSQTVMDRLLSHDWPGNVRELRNAIERSMVLKTDPLSEAQAPGFGEGEPAASGFLPWSMAKSRAAEEFERQYLQALMQQYANNISQCARAAGVDRRNFQRLLRKHGIHRSKATPTESSTP